MCPDLKKCFKSVRMEQFPLLFSHRNLQISLLSDVTYELMSGARWINAYGWVGDCMEK